MADAMLRYEREIYQLKINKFFLNDMQIFIMASATKFNLKV